MAVLIDGRIFLNHVGEVPAQVNMQILYNNMFYGITFFRWKMSPQNVEYMTRIIFLGGNPNRRPDIFKSCRRDPGPSEHANIIKQWFAWSYVSDENLHGNIRLVNINVIIFGNRCRCIKKIVEDMEILLEICFTSPPGGNPGWRFTAGIESCWKKFGPRHTFLKVFGQILESCQFIWPLVGFPC